MAGAQGGAIHEDEAAALEDTIDNGFGQVRIMEHLAPVGKRLVGGEDHGPVHAHAAASRSHASGSWLGYKVTSSWYPRQSQLLVTPSANWNCFDYPLRLTPSSNWKSAPTTVLSCAALPAISDP